MRVTGNSFTNSFVNQLNLLAARQQRLQSQAATGQRITAPEDDPAAMQRTMGLRNESQSLQQYATNISRLQDRATTGFGTLKAIKKISDRASELATMADGTRSPDELKTYATEVTQLIKQAAQLMNAKHNGNYIFGGTQTDQPPFALIADPNGNVTSVTYQGNTTIPEAQIESGGVTLAVDVPGANTNGNGPRGLITDSRAGADFFNHLISLQNNLLSGNTAAIATTDRPALTADENNLIYHIGNSGAVQTRLETAASLSSERSLNVDKLVSKEADADLTDTLVHLNQAQYAYQAALQGGSGILKSSLLDYIR